MDMLECKLKAKNISVKISNCVEAGAQTLTNREKKGYKN